MALLPAELTLRPLAGQAEYSACVRLQQETWGAGFTEIVPANLLQIAQKVGGMAAGAFDEAGTLQGFVFGLTGVEDGRTVHWSHMLAVRAEARDRGIGRALKQYQRTTLREQGVARMYWTFDPLVARNAHLNLERLGVEVVEYVPDMYGSATGSVLHDGLGTDRLVVAWDLRSPREPRSGNGGEPVYPENVVRIEIPDDVQRVRDEDPEDAMRWRRNTRSAFQQWLGRGWRVAAFERDLGAGRCWYVLADGGVDG